MAGSVKWFIYQADGGDTFALKADESNVEAIMGTTGDYLADTALTYALPSNLIARTVVYSNAARTRNLTIPVLTNAAYETIEIDTPTIVDPISGGNLTITRKRPEVVTMLPVGDDTGLTDGDAT